MLQWVSKVLTTKTIACCTHYSYDGDEGSEGQLSTAHHVRSLVCGTSHAVCSEADGVRQLHLVVSSQQPQQQGDQEGEDATVGVGLLRGQVNYLYDIPRANLSKNLGKNYLNKNFVPGTAKIIRKI